MRATERGGKASEDLFTFRDASQQRADFMGCELNLLASLLHSSIVGFRCQERRSSYHDGELIVDGVKNLLGKNHATPSS